MATKPFVRNITEEEEWQPYDPGNMKGASEWASDNAWDDWQNMADSDCERLLDDLVRTALGKREQAKLPEDVLERLCQELNENAGENLESVFQSIMDASTWAWEIAYTPSDRDIEQSMASARKDFSDEIRLEDYWDPLIKKPVTGPKEWSPRGLWTEQGIFDELTRNVRYRRKPGYYDRFVVFDWPNSAPVRDAKRVLKTLEDGRTSKEVDQEIEQWADQFMWSMFSDLEKRMQDADTGSRVDFGPMWKSVLSDKQRMNGVRRDILEFFGLSKPRK